MSVLLMGQVWAIDLKLGDQAVLLALADHAKDDGTDIYPSLGLLAWKTGLSERQVRRILRKLETMQIIVAVAYASGGRGHPTRYEMHVENGPQKLPFQRVKGDIGDTLKGDIGDSDPQRGTFTTLKADIHDTKGDIHDTKGGHSYVPRTIREPSKRTIIEPSGNHHARAHAREPSPPENQLDDFWSWLRRQPGGAERFTKDSRWKYMARYERERESQATP